MELIELIVLIPSFPLYFRLLSRSPILLFLHSSLFTNILFLDKLMLPTYHRGSRIHWYCIEELVNALTVKLQFTFVSVLCKWHLLFSHISYIDIMTPTIKGKTNTIRIQYTVGVMVLQSTIIFIFIFLGVFLISYDFNVIRRFL